FENEKILEQLVVDIEFQPFLFSIEKLSVMVYGLGSSSHEEFMGAGPGYVSSLSYKYNKKQSIYVQKITNASCIIEVWCNNKQVNRYEGATPLEVWKKTNILKSMNGNTLFGLDHIITQTKLRQLHIPT
ncbi:1490_t:CDS:1, partial [Funneliformis caledonium]